MVSTILLCRPAVADRRRSGSNFRSFPTIDTLVISMYSAKYEMPGAIFSRELALSLGSLEHRSAIEIFLPFIQNDYYHRGDVSLESDLTLA